MNEQQFAMNTQQAHPSIIPMATGRRPLWVYNLIEREKDGVKKTIWSKIGIAFVNRDGSLNLQLDSIPLTGKIHVREDKPERDGEWVPRRGTLSIAADNG